MSTESEIHKLLLLQKELPDLIVERIVRYLQPQICLWLTLTAWDDEYGVPIRQPDDISFSLTLLMKSLNIALKTTIFREIIVFLVIKDRIEDALFQKTFHETLVQWEKTLGPVDPICQYIDIEVSEIKNIHNFNLVFPRARFSDYFIKLYAGEYLFVPNPNDFYEWIYKNPKIEKHSYSCYKKSFPHKNLTMSRIDVFRSKNLKKAPVHMFIDMDNLPPELIYLQDLEITRYIKKDFSPTYFTY